MPEVFGCFLPEELYYWPEKHVWARPEADGNITIGITDVAQHLAKSIISATAKRPGKSLERGRSAGTLESGKWVGPVNTPVSGQIIAVNEALAANPKLLNDDPYGAGWFIRLRPSNWEAEKVQMVFGAAGVETYRQFLEKEGISCQ